MWELKMYIDPCILIQCLFDTTSFFNNNSNNNLTYIKLYWAQYGTLTDTFNLPLQHRPIKQKWFQYRPLWDNCLIYLIFLVQSVRISETNACCGDSNTTRISYASRASTRTSHPRQVSLLLLRTYLTLLKIAIAAQNGLHICAGGHIPRGVRIKQRGRSNNSCDNQRLSEY